MLLPVATGRDKPGAAMSMDGPHHLEAEPLRSLCLARIMTVQHGAANSLADYGVEVF